MAKTLQYNGLSKSNAVTFFDTLFRVISETMTARKFIKTPLDAVCQTVISCETISPNETLLEPVFYSFEWAFKG
jgi:hypothetical protein